VIVALIGAGHIADALVQGWRRPSVAEPPSLVVFDVIAARATHVTGDYWKVWPTVFYASWLLGAAGRQDWPYGITDRSIATLPQSLAVPQPRVAVLDGRSMWLGLFGPRRWSVAERRSTIVVLTAP